MTDRERALAEIAEIADRHGLSADEVRAALEGRADRGDGARPAARQGPLARALAYLGGTFVLAGLAVFVGTFWHGMNSAERIVSTLGPGICAFVLAVLAGRSEKRERLTTPLFVLAVLLEPTGMFVACAELGSGGSPLDPEIAVGLVMLFQCLAYFAKARRTAALFAALGFAALAMSAGMLRAEVPGGWTGLAVGTSLFCLTRAIDRTEHRVITPFWYFVSAAAVLVAYYEIVEKQALEVTEVAVAALFVYLSTRFRSRTLLATGCVGLLAYVGYYTSEHFADSIGWPIALILLGILMMGLGAFAVRIHRRYIRSAPSA
jgi:hypothetical protein